MSSVFVIFGDDEILSAALTEDDAVDEINRLVQLDVEVTRQREAWKAEFGEWMKSVPATRRREYGFHQDLKKHRDELSEKYPLSNLFVTRLHRYEEVVLVEKVSKKQDKEK